MILFNKFEISKKLEKKYIKLKKALAYSKKFYLTIY